MTPPVCFAGFWRRFAAYLIDAIPITIIVAMTYGQLIGLPPTMERYLRNPKDSAARAAYLQKRNECRNVSAIALVFYGTLLEGSRARGTVGKRLLGMTVQSTDGRPLGFGMAFVRNVSKLLSLLPLLIGFIWAAFDRRKQAWHDKFASSVVVVGGLRPSEHDHPNSADDEAGAKIEVTVPKSRKDRSEQWPEDITPYNRPDA